MASKFEQGSADLGSTARMDQVAALGSVGSRALGAALAAALAEERGMKWVSVWELFQ